MSRGYRIRATALANGSDSTSMELGLLEILPEAEMRSLLRRALAEDGWLEQDDGTMVRGFGSLEVRLSPEDKNVSIAGNACREVSATGRTRERAEDEVRRLSEQAQSDLQRSVALEVVAREGEVREAIQSTIQKVYIEALKVKARRLGQVESIQETLNEDGEVELTIKVTV